ncbi:MAG: hypothetical protein Unbinned3459contig1000_24 [Prokaryotic dsDNA virus sp.]|jgi:hypothetical protein|nr:MAG: hypothetical protein Unbinned3459contig1000_24 [Prokaryotic dsDNA virus sp.]|tara:strand:- start:29044 stop:29271 length:228 start_codon:yes stop_codon:yes gene_type:complete
MLEAPLTKEQNLQRGVALEGIATAAQDMADKGATPLEVQTFAQGAKRELAREIGDTGKMGEAAKAAKAYKDLARK